MIADGGTPASWLKTEISWRETAVESIESKLPANVNCTTTSWMVFISGGGGDGEAGGKAWEGSSGGGGGNGDGGGGGNGDGGGGERTRPVATAMAIGKTSVAAEERARAAVARVWKVAEEAAMVARARLPRHRNGIHHNCC